MKDVPNNDRRFGAADRYYLMGANGQPMLATQADIQRMRDRAEANPEDVQKRCSLPRRVWRAVFG
jgi:hypothetical protein